MNARATPWRETDVWPPQSTVMQRWYAGPQHGLVPHAPDGGSDIDTYAVDYAHGTGRTTRWTTSMGGPVHYGDRAEADRHLLCYTSAPLAAPLRISGEALVTLQVASTHDDAAFIVYLEHVAPDGRVRYVTEGHLRALHRGRATAPPPFLQAGPPRSFTRADLKPLVPGEVTEISFALLPTSVQFHPGDRIRIALAGADADSFARVPAHGEPVWTVHRSAVHATCIALPVHTDRSPA
jgi:putative CocE/NonD family hydrolase